MRALFVSAFDGPRIPRIAYADVPLGVSYLAASLARHGHQAGVLALSKLGGDQRAILDEALTRQAPQLLCFSSIYSTHAQLAEVAAYAKRRHPRLLLLAGGPHVTLNPAATLAGAFDAICVGEGEHALPEVVARLERGMPLEGIAGLWTRRGAQVEASAPAPFIEPLDRLPFPARALWARYAIDPRPTTMTVLISRGCPFDCSYCSNHALKASGSGAYLRFRTPPNIVAEIRELIARYPSLREIYLETETLAANVPWALALCAALAALNATLPRPLAYGANVRLREGVDYDRLFHACRRANFRFVAFGLETGNERMRRELLRREHSDQLILDAAAAARGHGLQLRLFNLIGLPDETPATIAETIRLNRRCRPDTNGLSIFFPYPGTDLHRTCRERGLLPETVELDAERSRAVLKLPGISRRELVRAYIWFDYRAFRGQQPLAQLLLLALSRWVNANDRAYRLWCRVRGLPFVPKINLLLRRAVLK